MNKIIQVLKLSTSPYEENIVVSVLSFHPVHRQLCEFTSSFGVQQNGPPVNGLHGLEHEGMGTHKTKNLVWVRLRTGELASVYLTGTLWETKSGEYEYAYKHSSPSHETLFILPFCFSWFANSCPASRCYNLLEQETNQKSSGAWLKPPNCLLKGQLSETLFFICFSKEYLHMETKERRLILRCELRKNPGPSIWHKT